MATTYTCIVNSLDCSANTILDPDALTDCDEITSILWTLSANNGTTETSITSRTPVTINMVPGPQEANNSVFNALTEANVISIIQHTIGSNQIAQLEAQLVTNLANMSNITLTPALPWI